MNQVRAANVIEAVAGHLTEKIIRAAQQDGTDPRTTAWITVTLRMTAPNGSQKRYTLTQPLMETERKLLAEAAFEPAPAVILNRGV